MRKKRRRLRGVRSVRVLILSFGVCALLIFTYAQLRPAVRNAAAYQVNIFATRILNEAILEHLGDQDVVYGDLIRLTRNAGGDIVAIESDMVRINRLKANVTQSVVDSLEEMGTAALRVPLGTLMGNEFTAGRGPLVEIRVYPIGFVQTDLYSQFTEAGINQTLHQIMLGTSVRMRAVIPGYSIQADVSTGYLIAETVIVGNIPEAYTRINLGSVPIVAGLGGYSVEN